MAIRKSTGLNALLLLGGEVSPVAPVNYLASVPWSTSNEMHFPVTPIVGGYQLDNLSDSLGVIRAPINYLPSGKWVEVVMNVNSTDAMQMIVSIVRG